MTRSGLMRTRTGPSSAGSAGLRPRGLSAHLPPDEKVNVGSAGGTGSFWNRWTLYSADGHGGNIALIGPGRSDWPVRILQVAGSADTTADILAREVL